jgi:hypothetical protein
MFYTDVTYWLWPPCLALTAVAKLPNDNQVIHPPQPNSFPKNNPQITYMIHFQPDKQRVCQSAR